MTALVNVLSVGFPLFIWLYGWEYPRFIALYLVLIVVLRIVKVRSVNLKGSDIALILGGTALVIAVFSGFSSIGLYYPVLVNAVLLGVFSKGLVSPPSIIESIARRQEKDSFDSSMQRYTHQLTKLWCVFFVINGLISFCLAYLQHLELWAIYTGIISYGLVGILFFGEKWMRPRILDRMRTQKQSII